MAKAASPIRLQEELMRSATVAAALSNRSASEQVEYWAFLGRSIVKDLDTESILALRSGIARLKVENIEAPAIDPEIVFSALEEARQLGGLGKVVTSSSVRYQASRSHPGQLERIDSNGMVTIGQFSNGKFTPSSDSM